MWPMSHSGRATKKRTFFAAPSSIYILEKNIQVSRLQIILTQGPEEKLTIETEFS